MPTIEQLFVARNARAQSYENYSAGNVAYVTNGLRDNGVLGYVEATAEDTVFDFMGIILSTFCEATVQIPPFIARGNGGSGLMVLEPRVQMSGGQLAHISAYINGVIRWRFNWYRQATVDRIRNLNVPKPRNDAKFGVGQYVIAKQPLISSKWPRLKFTSLCLCDLFEMNAGEYHNAGELPPGETPLISCGDFDNGIMAFVNVPTSTIHREKLTIAFNGDTLSTKYHPYNFAAKDDVAVCTCRKPFRLSTLFFIQLMMRREKWRYSYYRKCFKEKLERQCVYLPVKRGLLDEVGMEAVMRTTAYWDFIEHRMR